VSERYIRSLMRCRLLLAICSLAVVASPLCAQGDSPRPGAADSVFLRARRLVGDGQSAQGRALIDSVIRATPVTSSVYPEALYWRAVVSSTAADAERDYRRVAVEFSTSPRAAEAFLRLAQLEIARGDRTQAINHLQRLISEHPTSPVRPNASFWLADQLFGSNSAVEIPRACAALADARAGANPSNVELKNQIEFYQSRCRDVAVAPPAVAPTSEPLAPSAGTSTNASPPRDTPTVKDQRPVTTPPSTAGDTMMRAASPSVPRVATQPAQLPPVTRVDVDSAKPAASATNRPATPASKPATGAKTYTVQVAAYNTSQDAARLVTQLSQRGYAAHVEGTSAPFRVRVGRYATRAQAVAAAEEMKAKKIYGFVAESMPEAGRP
jgi:cell division protein FtsN